MSMNLIIDGEREIIVDGNKIVETMDWDIDLLRQTPTTLTYEVLKIEDFDQQLETYFNWVKELTDDQDLFQYHKEEVTDHIDSLKKNGWKVSFSMI